MSVPVAYAVMILVWATTPLTIKMSTESITLELAALVRVAIGAAVGALLVLLLNVRVPWHRQAWRTYVLGNINVFVGVFFTFKGAQHLPSGMVSVLFGLSPVLSPIFARMFLKEQALSLMQWLAVLLGVLGLVLVFREQVQISQAHLTAVIYVLGAVICFCSSNVFLKRWPGSMSALAQTTGTLIVGIPLYAGLALSMGVFDPWAILERVHQEGVGTLLQGLTPISDRSFYSILYLGVFGSLLGVMCYFYALTHLSAGTVALATLITPLLALSLGRGFNNETLTAGEMVGAACIIGALALYSWGGALEIRIPGKTREAKPGVLLK